MFGRLNKTIDGREDGGAFRKVYLVVIVVFFLDFIFQFFLSEKLIYFLYGYDSAVLEGISAEEFTAFKKTLAARNLSFSLFGLITFSCLFCSLIATYRRIYLGYFTFVIFAFTLLLLILAGFETLPTAGVLN